MGKSRSMNWEEATREGEAWVALPVLVNINEELQVLSMNRGKSLCG